MGEERYEPAITESGDRPLEAAVLSAWTLYEHAGARSERHLLEHRIAERAEARRGDLATGQDSKRDTGRVHLLTQPLGTLRDALGVEREVRAVE
jgi:hypothetical protein